MVEAARAGVIHEVENAIESMSFALKATPRGALWTREEDPRPTFLAYLGTTAPTPWICPEAVEITLRLFPADISPDRSVIVASRWTSPPGQLVEPTIEVLHIERADVVLTRTAHVPTGQAVLGAETGHIAALVSVFGSTTFTPSSGPLGVVGRQETATGPGAEAARAIRELSELSASALGELFPVARESFQRWLPGTVEPSPANLRRLLSLRSLFEEARVRMGDVRVWLSTPVRGREPETPYELLRAGRLTVVWDELLSTRSKRPYEVIREPGGESAVRVTGAVRSVHAPTPSDEADDLSDWPEDQD